MKRCVGLIILIVISLPSQLQAKDQAYQNAKLKVAFLMPEGWQIVPDENNNYLALYSPVALAYANLSPDLVAGIKIEIYTNQSPDEISRLLKQPWLRQVKPVQPGLEEFEAREGDCYCRYALIRGRTSKAIIVGYFPELKKEAILIPLFQKIAKSVKID